MAILKPDSGKRTSVVLRFMKTEAGGGILLVAAAVIAIIAANSPVANIYFDLLKAPLTLDLGFWQISQTSKDWVKNGLMAIFFYVIGLELKRELTVGELSDPRAVVLPVAAAIGGAIGPILVYLSLAGSLDPRGWPVPVATDIAFALAALAILAPRADPRVRLFLLTLAVVDDLMAIVLIAILFTGNLDALPLFAALGLLGVVAVIGRFRALPIWLYPLAAIVVWALAQESGVHSSVLAVAAAMVVPPRKVSDDETVLVRLEHFIHPISAFVVLPIFAFSAAGIPLAGLTLYGVASGMPAAIALALAVGKPIGVTLFTLLAAGLSRSRLPFSQRELVGIGCLCGIGFTMSLFISALAFGTDAAAEAEARLGVLIGSMLSLVSAGFVFKLLPVLRRP